MPRGGGRRRAPTSSACATRAAARCPTQVAAGGRRGARRASETPLGIHCHNDCELAVANSLAAIEHGCVQVQGTINGFGERCGNANLVSVIPALQLKRGYAVRQRRAAAEARRACRTSSTSWPTWSRTSARRSSARAPSRTRAGSTSPPCRRTPTTYEHIDPALVGNAQRVLVSDLAGRSNLLYKAARVRHRPRRATSRRCAALLQRAEGPRGTGLRLRGRRGAPSSCSCRRRSNGDRVRHFRLIGFRVIDEKRTRGRAVDRRGDDHARGPRRPDRAHRGAGQRAGATRSTRRCARRSASSIPRSSEVRLHDYKVRVLGGAEGTAALVRVLIESGDDAASAGARSGVSHNVVEASWQALVDSIDYKLYKERRRPAPPPRGGAHRADPRAGSRDARLPRSQRERAPAAGGAGRDAAPFLGPAGNPSSAHREGARARARSSRRARADVAALIGAAPARDRLHERRHRGEQPGAARRPRRAARRAGHDGDRARVGARAGARARRGDRGSRRRASTREGRVAARTSSPRAARARRSSSVGLANGEVGTRRAGRRDRRGARARGVLLHTDAAQAVGPHPGRRARLGVDLLSRLGAQARRTERRRRALGASAACALPTAASLGGPQERGRRAGTENVAGDRRLRRRRRAPRARIGRRPQRGALRDRLWDGMRAALPGRRAERPGDDPRLPNTLNVSHSRLRGREPARAARPGRHRRRRSARRAPPARPSRRTSCAPWAASDADARSGLRLSLGPDDDAGRDRPRASTHAAARWSPRSARGAAGMSERVVVAMSGGVDSAVAAARCVAAGYDVIGISLRLARGGGGSCCSLDDFLDARAVAERLGFPHYVFDFTDAFAGARRRALRRRVPRRPHPEPVRALQRAREVRPPLGAGARARRRAKLATGHYARIGADPASGRAAPACGARRGEGPDRTSSSRSAPSSSRGRSSPSAS